MQHAQRKRIGLVGLGLMGSGMARNLLAAGFPLVGYDIDGTKVQAVVRSGGGAIARPQDLPAAVDVIITSLPNSQIVREVVVESLGLFQAGRPGLVLIDTTTADPMRSEALAGELSARGMEMLDATLSGTSSMCAVREITVMVGGKEPVFNDCSDIFSAIAEQAFYVGKSGAGALTKLIVNLVLGLNRMALAEGLALAKKVGMDQRRLLDILKRSAAYSRAMDMKGLRMVEKDFVPAEGKLAFHLKDVQLMLDLAKWHQFPLLLSSVHAQALASEVAKGRGEWDNADIVSCYEELAGLD